MEAISRKLIILIFSLSLVHAQVPLNNEYLPPKKEYLPPNNPNNEYLPPKDEYGPPNHSPGKPITIDDDALSLPTVNFYRTMLAPGPSTSKVCPPNNPEFNRQLVLKAYQHAIGNKNVTGLESYFHEEYIQHNPMIPDGLDGIRKLLATPGIGEPVQIDFKRHSAQGDLVWLHSKLPFFGKVYAAVDIFRIECGKIKEHWDVLQDTQLQMSPMNNHPFF